MATSVDIAGVGARTPVGMTADASAAAVRAGITRLSEHPYMTDQLGDPMPAAMDPRLEPSLAGSGRLLALAESALREACESLAAPSTRLRVPLYLALPEIRPGFMARDVGTVKSGIAKFADLPVDIADVTVLPQGHAAGLAALDLAARQIRDGVFVACLVGGVDSYFHVDTMEWLDANRQLVGAVSRSGFVPGEGAGFCLLMSERVRANLGLRRLARVASAAVGRETKLIKTPALCLGEGLTTTVREALGDLKSTPRAINEIICDINTERYRGEEWGFVCLQLALTFDDPTGYLAPADCWGDVGAASGPLFAVLACHAAARGSAKGPRTMLWASSEGGLRGAAVLETAPAPIGISRRIWRVD
jgi:3-oxoacyl-[acyl-carrier-protein] synthase I